MKDEIEFEPLSTVEELPVRVGSSYVFSNFEEMYSALPLLKLGYMEQTVQLGHYLDMETIHCKGKNNVMWLAVKLY